METNNLRKAAEMALEALEEINKLSVGENAICLPAEIDGAMEALRQALAQEVTGDVDAVNMSQERVDETAKGEHEPWQSVQCTCGGTIYFKHTKREWVGLTEDEVIKCFDSVAFGQVEDDLIINKHVNIFRAIHGIEARLKEKNT